MNLLDAAYRISGWHERRKTALAPIASCLGVQVVGIDQGFDWNAVPLASYLSGPPLSYYLEPAFTQYYKFLNDRFQTDLAAFTNDLANCGQDVWKGLALAESLARDIYATDIKKLDAYERVGNYLNPWYLRLVEQAFDSLLALPAHRLQSDVGKNASRTPRGIYCEMKKHGWLAVGGYYDPTMRNGIGHDVEFIQDNVSSDPAVRYKDANGNVLELSVPEIITHVEGLLDECLAYCFALRLFLFENRKAASLAPLVHPTCEAMTAREFYFKQVASSDAVVVNAVRRERVNGQVQIRIECTDSTTHDNERLVEVLSILSIAAHWFPDGETFFIGLSGHRRLAACLRISGEHLRAWVSGAIADESLVQHFDPCMLSPLNMWFGYTRAKLRRAVSAGMKQVRQGATFRDHSVGTFSSPYGRGIINDVSTGLARRYAAKLFVTPENHVEIKGDLPSLLTEIRAMRVFANRQVRNRWGARKPDFVSGLIFSREKRDRDLWVDRASQFYIGKFEWRSPECDPAKLPDAMSGGLVESLDGGHTLYEPNSNWPPKDLFIPRV